MRPSDTSIVLITYFEMNYHFESISISLSDVLNNINSYPLAVLVSDKHTMMKLRIFYDANCPLCAAEMRQLTHDDTLAQIELQDINAADFVTRFSHIDKVYANQILHGETSDGRLLLGLDVTAAAWSIVGTKTWVKWLRLPLIKPVADWCYLKFAKHRYRISFWLTGQSRCDQNQCSLDKK